MFVFPSLAWAHDRPPAPAAAPAAGDVHKLEKVGAHTWCIFGQGGNIGLVVTKTHAVLIDDQFEKLAPGLLTAIKSVTPNPIRYLVNTHFHPDHTGANAALEKQVEVIVAHANVRARMKTAGLPEVAFGEDNPKTRAQLTLYPDGEPVVLVHVGPAHTDGDLFVWLPEEKVLHMGDLFFSGLLPYIDVSSGGSLAGYLQNLDAALAVATPDAKVIPGHGPVSDMRGLGHFRDFLRAVEAHVAKHRGETPAQLAASFDQKAWPDIKPKDKFVTWESFFGAASH
jgi:glyoxylase-like metal-dependent hydrolase (beta-lactamase superfamily II)